jgi:hypothetical protein
MGIIFDTNYLYKLRDYGKAVLMDRQCTCKRSFYSKYYVEKGSGVGIAYTDEYNADGSINGRSGRFDIIAYKKYSSQSQAVGALLKDVEPEWDWQRPSEEKSEMKPQNPAFKKIQDAYGSGRNEVTLNAREMFELINMVYDLEEKREEQ